MMYLAVVPTVLRRAMLFLCFAGCLKSSVSKALRPAGHVHEMPATFKDRGGKSKG